MVRRRVRNTIKRWTRVLGWELARWPVDGSFGYDLARVLSLYRINLVLDVGANDGSYARFLRSIGYRGHIVSFEPTSAAYARLAARAAGNRRWSTHHFALGSRDGEATIHITGNDCCSSLLEPIQRESWKLATGLDLARDLDLVDTETVQVRRLDGIFEQVAPRFPAPLRVLLKLDTQGYDVEVFRGAEGILPAVAALQSEVSVLPIYAGMPGLQEALAQYRRAGFREAGFFAVSAEHSLATLEFDCLMVRPEHAARARGGRGLRGLPPARRPG